MPYRQASRFVVLFVCLGTSSSSSPSTFWNETVVESRRLSPPSVEAGLLDVHIPKTGGTSLMTLWAILVQSRHLCASEVYQTHIPKRNITDCNDVSRLRLLSGHASLNLQAASNILPARRILTLLVLREPLARIVSFANFQNVHLEHFEGHKSFWMPYLGSNSMTKFVNGVEGTTPLTKGGQRTERIKGMCEYDDTDAIRTAQYRLSNVVTVFGITEYFVESVWLFGKTFDWPQSMIASPFVKASAGFCNKPVAESLCGKWRFSVADLEQETVAYIREHERCDFEVYRTGLDIFLSRLDAASPEDKEDLEKFKSAVLSGKAKRNRQRV